MLTLKPKWSKPTTILFATECPANETNFTFALARAKESRANLVVLHICDERTESSAHFAKAGGIYPGLKHFLEPLVQRALDLGIRCRVVVREGIASDEILRFAREEKVDSIVMGVQTPGPVGRLLVGSVAETILRKADLPVTIASPFLKGNACCDFSTRTILCSVRPHRSSEAVARFAAEMAAQHRAHLVLQRVIAPQEFKEKFAGSALNQMELELVEMIPAKLRAKKRLTTMAVLGDPTEELLYRSRVLHANLIVMGAHDATQFGAMSNSGMVYKVLAYAPCPVVTLSPVVLAGYRPVSETYCASDNCFIAGVV